MPLAIVRRCGAFQRLWFPDRARLLNCRGFPAEGEILSPESLPSRVCMIEKNALFVCERKTQSEECLKREKDRVSHYLHSSSKVKLFEVTDLTLARENQANFEEYLSNNPKANPGIDLMVTVLTIGFWPSTNLLISTFQQRDVVVQENLKK